MLLSVPSKILTRIILERLKKTLDKTLREEQAGFRQDRSCTDHIATLPITIEQSLEWQSPLYLGYSLTSKRHSTMWIETSSGGSCNTTASPPSSFPSYSNCSDNSSCQVIHEGKLTDTFQVQTGVRQGCLLSPTIFLLVVDWIMKQTKTNKKTGIQWTFTKQLEDLDFADDISLLSHRHQDAQEKLSRPRRRSWEDGPQYQHQEDGGDANKQQETRPHHTPRRRPERGGEVCLLGQRRQQRWRNRWRC